MKVAETIQNGHFRQWKGKLISVGLYLEYWYWLVCVYLNVKGEEHLSKVSQVRYVVIDEADRMIEKGHFQELTDLFQLINNNQ